HSRSEVASAVEKPGHAGDEFSTVGGQGGQDGLGAQHTVLALHTDNGCCLGVPLCRSHQPSFSGTRSSEKVLAGNTICGSSPTLTENSGMRRSHSYTINLSSRRARCDPRQVL